MEKTYKVHIYAQASGPQGQENIMSFGVDSQVTNGLVLTYPGAKPRYTSANGFTYFNTEFSDRYTQFFSNTGKRVITNLPVVIEEE